jgi:uncharacterized protein YbjT (DUF2867 family)
MRIVVSGATGNTGVAVVETLSKIGNIEVVALSRTPASAVSKRLAALPNVTVVKKYSPLPPMSFQLTYFSVNLKKN